MIAVLIFVRNAYILLVGEQLLISTVALNVAPSERTVALQSLGERT